MPTAFFLQNILTETVILNRRNRRSCSSHPCLTCFPSDLCVQTRRDNKYQHRLSPNASSFLLLLSTKRHCFLSSLRTDSKVRNTEAFPLPVYSHAGNTRSKTTAQKHSRLAVYIQLQKSLVMTTKALFSSPKKKTMIKAKAMKRMNERSVIGYKFYKY